MNKQKIKQEQRDRRRGRIRVKISGSKDRPRLSVFKSNKNLYLQLIDDGEGKTLDSAHSREIKASFAPAEVTPSAKATDVKKVLTGKKAAEDKDKKNALGFELGRLIAKKAISKKIKKIVFDRGGYKYHGVIKDIADGAREG